jgi:hypothetical protein
MLLIQKLVCGYWLSRKYDLYWLRKRSESRLNDASDRSGAHKIPRNDILDALQSFLVEEGEQFEHLR